MRPYCNLLFFSQWLKRQQCFRQKSFGVPLNFINSLMLTQSEKKIIIQKRCLQRQGRLENYEIGWNRKEDQNIERKEDGIKNRQNLVIFLVAFLLLGIFIQLYLAESSESCLESFKKNGCDLQKNMESKICESAKQCLASL